MVLIVTDATVRYPSSAFFSHKVITVAPMSVRCGDLEVYDGPTTDLKGMSKLMGECPTGPHVEAPSVDDIARIYKSLQRETNQIISLHSASGLSNVYQNALAASQQFRGRMDIHVIDSETISLGLGLLVQAAALASERGEDFESIVRLVRGMIPRLYTVMFLEDLFFLERRNLVSRSQAILGNMLGIVPFLTIEDGHLIPMEKVRSRHRAVEKMIEFICEFSYVEHLGILQPEISPTDEGRTIAERLRVVYPSTPIATVCYGPVISTYVGLSSVGAVVLETSENGM